MRSPIRSCSSSSVDGGEPRQITTGPNTWSQPRFTPDGRTLLAVLETQGSSVYNLSRLAALSWPELGSSASSPTASIGR